MFNGGNDGTQAPQDNLAVDPAAAAPADDSTSVPDLSLPASVPPADEAAELPVVAPPASAAAPMAGDGDSNGLLNIKQQALQQLTPLLGHLNQTPDERFRTTMMMIQASDNSALLSSAYEAAQQITDEKMRAQALLDVVNEINYFTQYEGGSEAPVPAS
jgi:hypothetical protein